MPDITIKPDIRIKMASSDGAYKNLQYYLIKNATMLASDIIYILETYPHTELIITLEGQEPKESDFL